MIFDNIVRISIMLFVVILIGVLVSQVLSQETNPFTNPSFYNISVTDCDKYLPSQVYQLMQQYNPTPTQNLTVPAIYLQNCINVNNSGYNKRIGPYGYSSPTSTWTLSIGMAISELVSLDVSEVLQLKINVDYQWNDPRLQWNTSSNLSSWKWPKISYLPVTDIWTPSIYVLTHPSGNGFVGINKDVFAYVESDGTVLVHDVFLLSSACSLDFTYFPRDNQTCVVIMLFLFQGVDESKIRIQTLNYTEADYVATNAEWVITSADLYTATDDVYRFQERSPNAWILTQIPLYNHSLFLALGVKRTPNYYMDILVTPVLIIVLVGVFMVIIRSDTPDRPMFILTVLLAYVFYQSTLATMQPKSDPSPLLGTYMNATFALFAAFFVCSITVLRIWQKDNNSPPPLLVRLVLIRPIHWPLQKLKGVMGLLSRGKRLQSREYKAKNENRTTLTRQPEARDVAATIPSESAISGSANSPANSPDSSVPCSASGKNEIAKASEIEAIEVAVLATGRTENHQSPNNIPNGNEPNLCTDREPTSDERSNAAFGSTGETWHALALYLHVLSCIAFIGSNIGIFFAYMVPIFIVGTSNNAKSQYYNTSSLVTLSPS